jgi:hypothetical protein
MDEKLKEIISGIDVKQMIETTNKLVSYISNSNVISDEQKQTILSKQEEINNKLKELRND